MGEALLGEPDRVGELAGCPLPLLVAYGERDNAWQPATQAAMAHRLGAEHVVIEGAAHSPAVENTAATVTALAAFWHVNRQRIE
jgi:pimeloyl-ACP methyl ester carboxylesterase